jgi:hypothetical protein
VEGLLLLAACAGSQPDPVRANPGFATLVASLSEPGGYFDTDNLISNEASYLHALGPLERQGVRGGAYLGVGPDQNFSYIARIRPGVAFVLDIRRDNLLQHLLFKALFGLSPTRVEYLAMLFGRPPPPAPADWTARGAEELTAWVDRTPPDGESRVRARRLVDSTVGSFGVPLSQDDRATIARFHETFIRDGLDLRFETFGRAPAWHYPTYRALLVERDLAGRPASYLARETDYAFLRDLQARDGVIPVVGDFAGSHALRAIGDYLRAQREQVSAFYTSNVEYYLFREGTFPRFAENVAQLPRSPRTVIIRSLFLGSFASGHPQAVPGYASVQLVQPMEGLGQYGSYRELVMGDRLR